MYAIVVITVPRAITPISQFTRGSSTNSHTSIGSSNNNNKSSNRFHAASSTSSAGLSCMSSAYLYKSGKTRMSPYQPRPPTTGNTANSSSGNTHAVKKRSSHKNNIIRYINELLQISIYSTYFYL